METFSQHDVSICIVGWNQVHLSSACLKSIVEQTKAVTYEIIFVDNNSSDGTSELVRSEFPSVKLIVNQTNLGFGRANNQALRVARGKYCLLLNNDMLLASDAVSRMVEYMDAHADVGVLGCRLVYPSGAVQMSAHGDPDWYDHLFHSLYLNRLMPKSCIFGNTDCTYLDFQAKDLAVEVGYVAGAALMVRTASLGEVGLFDEKIFLCAEDWEWCRRFARHGYRVFYYSGAEIVHYHGMSSIRSVSPNRDLVRQRSVLYLTASSHYVYRKLHAKQPFRILAFTFCFRLHWLSRLLGHGVLYLIGDSKANLGVIRGFFEGAVLPYRHLAVQYLNSDTK